MILTTTLNASIDKRYVVDHFSEGAVNRVKSCTYTPGGKGLNVSKPAAIYGEEVTATGFVGGHAGDYITENLKPFGITPDFYRVQDESRSCINIWDEANKCQTEFLEPGFTVSEKDFGGFLNHFAALSQKADVIEISGSVPRGLDGNAYRELIRIGKHAGKRVILDTSGELLRVGIMEKPAMIKPNIDEIRMLTRSRCDSREELIRAAKEIHDSGIEVVVISLGGDGSLMVCEEGVFRAAVPKIDAVNTVSCGDSMIAGFCIGFEKGLSLPETHRLASAISAAAAMRPETGFFAMEDMKTLLPQIRIEKL